MLSRNVNRRRLRLKFIDFFPGHIPAKDPLYDLISRYYDIELSDNPDYIIHGGLGNQHLFYNCIKITLIGENTTPDFNLFDYGIGFDHLEFGDRYCRCPLFVYWPNYKLLAKHELTMPSDEALVNRKFCSFVVSNGRGDPIREYFFKELSKYKRVDSGGRFLNNVGGPVKSKLDFCRQYKFNIAFENSIVPGYTTEKLMEPLLVHSVPIYYGNKQVVFDFNTDCMIHVESKDDIKKVIDTVVELDSNDEEYLRICKARVLQHPINWYEDCLSSFLLDIFEQPLSEARRVSQYGAQLVYRERLVRLLKIENFLDRPFLKRVRNGLYRVRHLGR